MNITALSPTQLRKAADIQERILGLQNELNQLLGGEVPTPAAAKASGSPKRRRMSATGRAAIAAAARARWAKVRSAKLPGETAPKRKSKFSAAAKARLAALARARWAKAKKAGKKTL